MEVLASAMKREKETKNIQIQKEEKSISICRQHVCLCRKSQNLQKKLLELIFKFSTFVGYKVNIQKPTVVLHAINEQLETGIEESRKH